MNDGNSSGIINETKLKTSYFTVYLQPSKCIQQMCYLDTQWFLPFSGVFNVSVSKIFSGREVHLWIEV